MQDRLNPELNPEEKKSLLENPNIPLGDKILNLDASRFEKSKYLDGRFRLKDLAIIKEIAPGLHEDAVGEIKEYNEALFETRGQVRKYNLGRKIGAIPTIYFTLMPELNSPDPAERKQAQDKFFKAHPELRTNSA